MKPVVRETVIISIELENLNDVVETELFGWHPDDDCWDYDWEHDYEEKYWKENEHIPIDLLVETANKLKAQGVTHVQIVPHCDHGSYYFTGVKLELMSEEDVMEKKRAKLTQAISHHVIRMGLDKEELKMNEHFLENLEKQLKELGDDTDR